MRLDWAVDVELAGAPYRFATRRLSVDGYAYQAGLSDLTLSRLIDFDEGIGLEISTRDDWPARFAAAGWVVDGGAATVWLVVEDDDGTSRRIVWQRGRVSTTQWEGVGDPISCEVRPLFRRIDLPNLRERIDPYTAPSSDAGLPTHTGTWNIYTDDQGEYYPIVIGYPGWDDVNEEARPVVPCPTIQYSDDTFTFDDGIETLPEVYVHVVGVGGIEASQVAITDAGLTATEESDTGNKQHPISRDGLVISGVGVTVAEDKLGQLFAWVPQDLTADPNYGIQEWSGKPAVFAAFTPADGGGITFQGKLLRGGADLFEWAIGQYTDAVIDLGRHRAHAVRLNLYHFDTFINDPQDAIDWFNGEILSLLPAAIVRGDEGVYLAHVPLRGGREDAVAHLQEGVDGVRWLSMESGSIEDVANEITFRWAPQRDLHSFLHTRTLTSEHQQAQAVPGGGVYRDTRALAHAMCLASQRAFREVRPATVDMPVVWEQSTAFAIAGDVALSRAFPSHVLHYSLPVEWYDLAPGEVVLLTDEGRSLDEIPCTIVDVQIGTTHVEVALRPCRGPESYL